ncbi:hypothetical protein ID866_10784 [Astraeus odoratus]|nr:hypothetical protein ID866_10784 [Astraeus odoratus]
MEGTEKMEHTCTTALSANACWPEPLKAWEQWAKEAEQKAWEEAEQLVRQEAEQKREEEEKAQRAEEAKKAAEAQRRTVERQHKHSMVIPVGGPSHRDQGSMQQVYELEAPTQVWMKAAGGVTQKQRRMEAKEDNGEDNEEDNEDDGEGDFVVLLALVQEHRDKLSALMTILSVLLKEFKGYCCEQQDLQAHQVRGLKALQREMRKANTLKVKELEATAKGKEKVAEVTEESSQSGEEEEEVENSNKGGANEGEGDNGDGCGTFSLCYVVFS